MTKSLPIRIVAVILLAVLLVVGTWVLLYPDGDPKNIKYVLWKTALYKMDLDTAASTMIADAHRDDIVVGRTKAQLRNRFGHLLTLAEATPYNRGCYQQYWKGKDVLFIRQTQWMVVFESDRASDLVLIKGC
jgi:hypothetical protein